MGGMGGGANGCLTPVGNVITVDIPVVNVMIGVTLDGQPLSAANSGDLDEGVLSLRNTETGEIINLGDTWNDTTDMPTYPKSLQLVLGTYDVMYAVQDDGPNWPSNTNARIVCIDVP